MGLRRWGRTYLLGRLCQEGALQRRRQGQVNLSNLGVGTGESCSRYWSIRIRYDWRECPSKRGNLKKSLLASNIGTLINDKQPNLQDLPGWHGAN